jgi:hypothetical protein
MNCVYCGVLTNLDYCKYDKSQFTLERKDNTKAHTKDNVTIACFNCNILRGNKFEYKKYYAAKLDQRRGKHRKINHLYHERFKMLCGE